MNACMHAVRDVLVLRLWGVGAVAEVGGHSHLTTLSLLLTTTTTTLAPCGWSRVGSLTHSSLTHSSLTHLTSQPTQSVVTQVLFF